MLSSCWGRWWEVLKHRYVKGYKQLTVRAQSIISLWGKRKELSFELQNRTPTRFQKCMLGEMNREGLQGLTQSGCASWLHPSAKHLPQHSVCQTKSLKIHDYDLADLYHLALQPLQQSNNCILCACRHEEIHTLFVPVTRDLLYISMATQDTCSFSQSYHWVTTQGGYLYADGNASNLLLPDMMK